jgi:U3 small nucleolar RNA-associated protein 14
MPGRQSTVLKSNKEKPQAKPRRKPRTGLDALAIAEYRYPEKPGLSRHRLGHEDDSTPKRKRDRSEEDEALPKRRRTGSDESSVEGGSDTEGNEWQIGKVDTDDDSEIDSDDALGSSDEEKFEGFTFRGSSQPKRGKADKKATEGINLSEEFNGLSDEEPEEDEEDDDLGEDAVDLATAWDMNAEESGEEDRKKKSSKKQADESDESMGESGSDELSDDESALSVSEDEDERKERGLLKLQKFVESLEPGTTESKAKKHSSAVPAGTPSEYGLMSSRKLTVEDLIPTITDSRLKSSLKHIDSTNSSSKKGKLDAPLAKRQQDRIERAAAYEKSKEALNRWIDTVKANRRAEHLSFPLPEPNAPQPSKIVDSKPRTDLETTVQDILIQSGLAGTNGKDSEEKLQEIEELHINKLPLEEIMARRAELRKTRELMFREEMRSKRIKKIKSKSYRRVHRREREREELKEREAFVAAGVDLEEEDRELQDRRRAEARMGAKHKESRWAKSLKQTGRTAWDEDARLEMADLARREEELQKRIEGRKVNDDDADSLDSTSDESSDESDASDEDGFASDKETKKLKRKLRQLESNGDVDLEAAGPHAKLMTMKFMQNAEATRKAANNAEIKRLNRELAGEESVSESEDAEGGRQKFGQQKDQQTKQADQARVPRGEFEEPETDEDRQIPDTTGKAKGTSAPKAAAAPHPSRQREARDQRRKTVDVARDDSPENPWLSEQVKGPRKKQKNPAGSLPEVALINPAVQAPRRVEKKQPSDQQAQSKLFDSEEDREDEDSEEEPIVLQNQDLVKKAFAGDEVLEEFSKEKFDTIQEEGDKVVDETLPGWGSWAGTGLSKREKKQVKRTFTTVEGVKPERRKDAKMDRVIINEKRVKKV